MTAKFVSNSMRRNQMRNKNAVTLSKKYIFKEKDVLTVRGLLINQPPLLSDRNNFLIVPMRVFYCPHSFFKQPLKLNSPARSLALFWKGDDR